MRTFKCCGRLANDNSSMSWELILQKLLIVDRRLKKSSHCRSPVLAPVRSAMFDPPPPGSSAEEGRAPKGTGRCTNRPSRGIALRS